MRRMRPGSLWPLAPFSYSSPIRSLFSAYRPLVILAIVLILGLALRLPNMGESLWYDELWATRVRLGSLYDTVVVGLNDNHPPFYVALMFAWTGVFGDSELSVRMLPLISGLATIPLTYLVCRRFVGANAALLAAGLVALSPAHIWYSVEARHYSFLLAALLVSVYAFNKLAHDAGDAQGKPGRRWLVIYGVSVVVIAFTFYYSAAYIGMISLLTLWKRSRSKYWALGINLATMASLFLFLVVKVVLNSLRTSPGHVREFDPFQVWMLLFNWFPTGNAPWPVNMWDDGFGVLLEQPWMLISQLFLATLFALGVFALLKRARNSDETSPLELLLLFAALPLLMIIMALAGLGQIFIERSMLTVLPFFYGIVALGVFAFANRGVHAIAVTALVVLSVVALTSFYKNQNEVWTVYKPNPDWRSAASYLTSEMEPSPGDSLVLVGSPADALIYYEPRFRYTRLLSTGASDAFVAKERYRNEDDDSVAVKAIKRLLRGKAGGQSNVESESYFPIFADADIAAKEPELFSDLRSLYILHNTYWTGDTLRLLEAFEQSRGLEQVAEYQRGGIVISKFVIIK